MAHNETGAAIGRLIELAKSDTHQASRVANFLLAWWNGPDWGHFPVADLFGLDCSIAADVTIVFAYLGQHGGAVYADAWGYREDMADLVEQWRPEVGTARRTA